MGYILVDHPNPYTAQGGWPRRGGAKLSGTCIMHTSEGNWRAGVVGLTRLLQNRVDHGSYHVGVDWDEIAWYYPWEWEAWQDSETNNWAVGISAACKTSDWLTMPEDIVEGFYRNLAVAAADFVLYMKNVYNVTVPLERISGEQARNRKPGFCAHGDSGVARSDPGRDFNWERFFRYTKEKLDGKVGFLMALSDEQQRLLYRQVCTPEGRAELAASILYHDIPWFGFEGKIPADGRKTTTLATDVGWADTGRANVLGAINALLESPRANITLTDADLDALANRLRDILTPDLVRGLGRKLSE